MDLFFVVLGLLVLAFPIMAIVALVLGTPFTLLFFS